jgi:hypothetical protein
VKLVHLVGFTIKKRRAYLNIFSVNEKMCVARDSGNKRVKNETFL